VSILNLRGRAPWPLVQVRCSADGNDSNRFGVVL
jgi:hypothetical protein